MILINTSKHLMSKKNIVTDNDRLVQDDKTAYDLAIDILDIINEVKDN